MTSELPHGLQPYRQTASFTAKTVPAGLLRDHATKSGIWGLIHVVTGTVIYRIADSGEQYRLTRGTPGVMEPEMLHSVEVLADAEFFVEFWKAVDDT